MAQYNPRLVAPSATNKNWIKTTKGGYNKAIMIKPDGSVLPNCVGYCWGRWCELLALLGLSRAHKLSTGNAENWFKKLDGYARGKTPKLGAVICFEGKGNLAGHVAIVEQINYDTNGNLVSIKTSNSAYKGTRFYLQTLKAPNYSFNSNYKFQGFIYFPYEWDDPNPAAPQPKPKFPVGSRIRIKKAGNTRSDGKGRKSFGINWLRYVLAYNPNRKFPYKIGTKKKKLTGYYKESALKKA